MESLISEHAFVVQKIGTNDIKKTVNNGSTSAVYKAWRNLGPPKLVVLKRNVSVEHLWSAEKKAIIKYGTLLPNGYNYKNGSDVAPSMLGKTLSEESKDKIRQNNLGKRHSEKTKDKMRASHKKYWEDPIAHEKACLISAEQWKDPIKREKAKQTALRYWKSDKAREEAGNRSRKAWSDPLLRKRASESHLGLVGGMLGKKHTEKTKNKMRKSHLKRQQRIRDASNSS